MPGYYTNVPAVEDRSKHFFRNMVRGEEKKWLFSPLETLRAYPLLFSEPTDRLTNVCQKLGAVL